MSGAGSGGSLGLIALVVFPSTGYSDMSGSASAPSLKEFQKHEQPTPGKSPHLPSPARLFDDDDNDNDDDDNNLFVPSYSKPSKTGTTLA